MRLADERPALGDEVCGDLFPSEVCELRLAVFGEALAQLRLLP